MFLGYLISVFPVVAVLSLVCYLPIYFLQRKKIGKRPFLRHLTIYALLGVIFSILFITIFMWGVPQIAPAEYRFYNLVPFIWVRETYEMGAAKMFWQLSMNIVMLIPFGIFLPAVFPNMRRWFKTAIVIFLFMLCIECVQYFIGRSADVDDLIMNTAGGMLGYGIFRLLHMCFREKGWWKCAVNPEA